jgi:Spy/CpxP family protein refolding chaperone
MTAHPSNPKRRRVAGIAIAASLIALVGGAFAFAHAGGEQHHGGHMAAHSAEHHLEHMRALLTKIGASEAQKSQISGLLEPALNEMKAVHEGHTAAMKQFHEGLLAPSVDRARLESLRAAHVKGLDEATRRMVTAMTDAAEVLSPEQRTALAREIANHHAN